MRYPSTYPGIAKASRFNSRVTQRIPPNKKYRSTWVNQSFVGGQDPLLNVNRDETGRADRKVRERDALRVPLVANDARGSRPALRRPAPAFTAALLPRVLKTVLGSGRTLPLYERREQIKGEAGDAPLVEPSRVK